MGTKCPSAASPAILLGPFPIAGKRDPRRRSGETSSQQSKKLYHRPLIRPLRGHLSPPGGRLRKRGPRNSPTNENHSPIQEEGLDQRQRLPDVHLNPGREVGGWERPGWRPPRIRTAPPASGPGLRWKPLETTSTSVSPHVDPLTRQQLFAVKEILLSCCGTGPPGESGPPARRPPSDSRHAPGLRGRLVAPLAPGGDDGNVPGVHSQ